MAGSKEEEVEEQVLEVRERLEENEWEQVGEKGIEWELEKLREVVRLLSKIERI